MFVKYQLCYYILSELICCTKLCIIFSNIYPITMHQAAIFANRKKNIQVYPVYPLYQTYMGATTILKTNPYER